MYTNELKYFVISDNTKKYDEINKKILKIAKIYLNTKKTFSSQIFLIENKINNNMFGDIKIKQLLENQHQVIKELIKIINEILLEKINNEVVKKYEDQSLDISDESPFQKNIITNKNLKMFSKPNYNNNKPNNIKSIKNTKNNNNKKNLNKNNINKSCDDNLISKKLYSQKEIIPLNIIFPKTNNDFNGALSFFKLNNNNNNVDNHYINKINNNYKPYDNLSNNNQNSFSSKSSFKPCNSNLEKFYKPDSKDKIYSYLKKNNNNFSYRNINYTIDEERNDNYSGINENQMSITSNNNNLTSITSNNNNNLDEEYTNLSEMLNSKKKKIKYRAPIKSPPKKEKDKNNNINNNSKRNIIRNNNSNNNSYRSINRNNSFMNSFPNFTINNYYEKNEDFFSKKRSNTSFNFFKSSLFNNNNKDQDYLMKFTKTKIYSTPYINNGKINSPSKLAKEILNTSYNKLNKYNRIKPSTSYQ